MALEVVADLLNKHDSMERNTEVSSFVVSISDILSGDCQHHLGGGAGKPQSCEDHRLGIGAGLLASDRLGFLYLLRENPPA